MATCEPMNPAVPVTSTFMMGCPGSKPAVHRVARQDILHVVDDGRRLAERTDAGRAQRDELPMADGHDHGVVSAVRGIRHRRDAVLVFGLAGAYPGIVDVDAYAIRTQC